MKIIIIALGRGEFSGFLQIAPVSNNSINWAKRQEKENLEVFSVFSIQQQLWRKWGKTSIHIRRSLRQIDAYIQSRSITFP